MDNYFDGMAAQWDDNPLTVERATVTANRIKSLELRTTDRCIDFGSGTGLLGVQLSDTFSKVHLLDASSEMLRVGREKIAQANITNVDTHHVQCLSALSGHYSAIVTLMALHHLDNIKSFFEQAYQRLAQQGLLVIADLVTEDGSFHKHNPDFTGHNGFDVELLAKLAESVGFVVESSETYYEIWQEDFANQKIAYPLFMMVARKV